MTRPDRPPLPTKEQINAITDRAALNVLRDDIERTVAKIETDLEFRAGDEDWASRARGALTIHRLAARQVGRRLGALARADNYVPSSATTKATPVRPEGDCDPLTIEVLRVAPAIVVDQIGSTAEIDEQMAWLAARINAVTIDREDEIGQPSGQRDEQFLAATGRLLREMRLLRQQLQNQRGKVSREERARERAAEAPVLESRERLFIDAAREQLDRTTYLRLWDTVDRWQGAPT